MHSFFLLLKKKRLLIDNWMFYICTFNYLFQPHAAPGHHDPYRAPPPVSYPSDHYSRPPTERWHSHWYYFAVMTVTVRYFFVNLQLW